MTDFLDSLRQPHALLLLRLVLGGLLLIAGVAKLSDRPGFYSAVVDYDVLPVSLARPFAFLMPIVEVTLGALLLLGLGTVPAAALAVPLFGSFSVAIGVNMLRGRHFDCHCFGSAHSDRVAWPALLRSFILAGAALFVALGASRFGALDAALFGSTGDLPPVSDVIPIVFAAFVVIDVLFLTPEFFAIRAAFRERQAGSARHGHASQGRETGMSGAWLASYVVLWAVVLFQGVVIFVVLRQLGIIYLGTAQGVARDGIAAGQRAPDFTLPDLAGRLVSLADFRGRSLLLVFGSTSCAPCRGLVPDLNELARTREADLSALFLIRGELAEVRRFVDELDVQVPVALHSDEELPEKYKARVTPFAFVIDGEGIVRAKGLANNREHLDMLLRMAQDENKGRGRASRNGVAVEAPVAEEARR